MSIFGISLFGSEHVLRAGDAILNGGLKLLCYQNVSLIDTPTLQVRDSAIRAVATFSQAAPLSLLSALVFTKMPSAAIAFSRDRSLDSIQTIIDL